jgi:hypothetical protein
LDILDRLKALAGQPASVARKLELPASGLSGAGDQEMRRILALPVSKPPTAAEIEELSRRYLHVEVFDGPEKMRFLPGQAWTIRDFANHGQAVGHLPVGGGKTLTSLMLAQLAYEQGIEKTVLFVPAQVRPQLVFADIPRARRWVNIVTPIVDLGGIDAQERAIRARRAKGLFIFPYSILSARDGEFLLDAIQPALVIADEAHMIRQINSARTKRFLKWVKRTGPFMFVPLSGTLTTKSLRDFHHLIVVAMRERAPIPIHVMAAANWSAVVDTDATPTPEQLAELRPLREWAGIAEPTVEGTRRAFQKRLNSTPGVIRDESDIGTSLTYANSPARVPEDYPGWKQITELMEQVESLFLTPDGDEIDHAIHTWKWLEELTAGFYHRLSWPDLPAAVLARAKYHHATAQCYHKELRGWLKQHGKKGIDTPFLVGQDMLRNGEKNVGAKLYALWRAMKDADWEGRPERDSQAVRLCDYKVAAAARWADSLGKDEGGIIWIHHRELGRWIFERLDPARALWAPSKGERSSIEQLLLDPDACRNKIIVASMKAHGTGKNLQYLQRMLFVQFPRDATAAQQVVGRLHRTGQEADHLDAEMMRTTFHDDINFASCLNDALYIQQVTGARQKLIIADHDPLPRIYSPEFLTAQGLQPERLSKQGQDQLQQRFGNYIDLSGAAGVGIGSTPD